MIDKNSFIVLGRAGMDLYPDPPGTEIEKATSFFPALGGSSGNIAAGLGRLGSKVTLLSRVSDDAVGRFTLAQCHEYGIETGTVFLEQSEARTTLALSESRLDDCQTVIYRNNAADFAITEDDVAKVDWPQFGGLIFTGTSLAAEPSRAATFAAISLAKRAGVKVIMDVDYRAYSWASLNEACEVCRRAATNSDILIANDDEFDVLAGNPGEGYDYATSLAQQKSGVPELIVYKKGAEGSVAFADGQVIRTGIYPVTALKPTGAGDSFMAASMHALANNFELHQALLRGSAAAAIVVTRVGCAPAMPTNAELIDFMSQQTMTV